MNFKVYAGTVFDEEHLNALDILTWTALSLLL
jgi:hypothetical protein